jgi:hypothetical protein
VGIPRDWRGLTWWTIAFVAGVLLIAYAPGAWPALGTLIVAPTVITLMLFAWGFLLYRLAKLFGGNPKSNDSFGTLGICLVRLLDCAARRCVAESPMKCGRGIARRV